MYTMAWKWVVKELWIFSHKFSPEKWSWEVFCAAIWTWIKQDSHGYDFTSFSKEFDTFGSSLIWWSSVGHPELSQRHLHINFASILHLCLRLPTMFGHFMLFVPLISKVIELTISVSCLVPVYDKEMSKKEWADILFPSRCPEMPSDVLYFSPDIP